jgi:hypothetical protein
MKLQRLHPFSLLVGAALAVVAFVAMAHSPAPAKPKLDYKIVEDPTEPAIERLVADGWDYAGYLGQGVKGGSNDQTLWKRSE